MHDKYSSHRHTDRKEPHFVTCPMCAFYFDSSNTMCAHSCPLGSLCNLVKCPSCEYEFPLTPRHYSLISRLFRKRPDEDPYVPENVRRVSEMKNGESAEIACLGSSNGDRYGKLSVFGLEPGSVITLVQKRPATVIKIDETELAIDPDIADEILVHADKIT
jgi:Fe2+ transport system protein FeoA